MLLGSKTQGASLSWELVRHPWFTEKALRGTAGNKYVFRVAPHANKTEIKKLFERGYGVTVVAVNMVHIPPKTRKTRGGKTSEKPGYKKAVITLAAGDKLEFATQ
ncbi:MAG: 50S ribosomal protein L23 [Patescibacteria group bacterium]|nr:50S ribosomal protein L23 [Patescibacteria group bacterium]MDE2437809.1 50S ribosomal protein L23 [Patescibacteria group bacterium]